MNAKRIKQGKNRIRIIITASVLPIFVLLIWEAMSSRGLVNQSILPAPSKLMEAFIEMFRNGKLQMHLLISWGRVLKGFAAGAAAGLVIGIAAGLSSRIAEILSAIIGILRPIPIIAWVPLLILWMGIDEGSKVTLIAIGTFWPVFTNTSRGIKSADQKLLEVGIVFEKSHFVVLRKIVIPSALPYIFTGIRIGLSAAWSCVVSAEMIAAATGIGYLIMYARELSQPDIMLTGVLSIGLVGLLLDFVLIQIEKRTMRWHKQEIGR